MSLLLELAGNKAKARAAAKELTIPQLENLIEGFTNALEKAKAEEAALAAEQAAKSARAEEIAALIASSGLTMEEVALLSVPKAKKAGATKGKTVAPKYRLVVDGETHEWTGRGRTPKVFQEYFNAGNSRKSVEIK
ncbi:MAG: H-NS histone family protein [Marinomonas sp.]|uniref:H-NS histone family protein n=1 Tax=unclassified Marinomonas TaxID=196814 RepID=UPI002934E43C|nr:H-NS histone family protein [Marinomonas sp. GJ51-6]WOD06127.1 H-NS histone family protein [Marinomonas sp. GJ51-6]